MAKRTRYTPEFKAEVVLEALSGESSQAELCRRHNLSENQVSTWKRQLLENVETFLESETDKPSSESAERIAQLEQLVGRLTLAFVRRSAASPSVHLFSPSVSFNTDLTCCVPSVVSIMSK